MGMESFGDRSNRRVACQAQVSPMLPAAPLTGGPVSQAHVGTATSQGFVGAAVVIETGKPIAEVARDLGVSDGTLGRIG